MSGGGRNIILTLQRPSQIKDTSINIAGSKYFSESCHIYLSNHLGGSKKHQLSAGLF